MTETEQNTSPEMPEPPKRFYRKAVLSLFVVLLTAALALTGLHDCPWFMGLQRSFLPTDATETKTRLASLERRMEAVEVFENNATNAHVENEKANSDVTTPSLPPTSQATPSMVHMQNDLVALSSALSAVEAEVKKHTNDAAQDQRQAEAMLGEAIAFIQLREAATAGHEFTDALAVMREASRNDVGLQESLAKLEPYAGSGAPTLSVLRNQFTDLEASMTNAMNRTTAQNWWQRILVELKSLIVIRPLQGAETPDAFAAIESSLDKGDATAALSGVNSLPPEAQLILADWKTNLIARTTIDDVLTSMAAHFTATVTQTSAPGAP